MEFRIHEVLSWIVPGIYLTFLSLIFWLCGSEAPDINNLFPTEGAKIPSDLITALAIFAIPVIGLIVGYVVNYIASLTEHYVYRITYIPRPSNRILNNKTNRSKVANLSKLHELLKISITEDGCLNDTIDNEKARNYRDIAVQAIDHETMERYYFRMIFGRNMTMSQILAYIASFFLINYNWTLFIIMTGFLMIFALAYYRDSMTHTKYSFVEYMRIKINNKEDDNNK